MQGMWDVHDEAFYSLGGVRDDTTTRLPPTAHFTLPPSRPNAPATQQGCRQLQTLQIDKCYSVSASAVEALLKRLPSASKARYWTGFAPQSAMIISYHKRRRAQIAGAIAIQKRVSVSRAWLRECVRRRLTVGDARVPSIASTA